MQVCLKCFQTGLIDRGVGGAVLLLQSHVGWGKSCVCVCVGVSYAYIVCVCAGVSHWDVILRMRLFVGENKLGERGISYLEESSLTEFIHSPKREEVGLLVQVLGGHFLPRKYHLYCGN